MAHETESLTLQVERLTLATLGEGHAEEQFAAFVEEFLSKRDAHVNAIDDGGLYRTQDGCLRATVQVAVELVHDVETGATSVAWSTTEKMPARKGSSTRVIASDGKLLVEKDGVQMALLKSSKRSQE